MIRKNSNLTAIARTRVVSLILNLLVVFLLFSLTRLVFVACNANLYSDHMSAVYLWQLMVAGLRFDCTAILYLNVIFHRGVPAAFP